MIYFCINLGVFGGEWSIALLACMLLVVHVAKEFEPISDVKMISWDAVNWRKFLEGDQAAYAAIYKMYFSKLYNYGCKLTKDKVLVEDAIQNLFVKLWNNRENLTEPASVKSYLFRAFRNTLIRSLQLESKGLSHDIDEEYHFEVTLSYEDELINSQWLEENKSKLARAFEELSKRQREALFLKYYENFTYEQIAEAMQLEIKSVYNLVSKAIEVLKATV